MITVIAMRHVLSEDIYAGIDQSPYLFRFATGWAKSGDDLGSTFFEQINLGNDRHLVLHPF